MQLTEVCQCDNSKRHEHGYNCKRKAVTVLRVPIKRKFTYATSLKTEESTEFIEQQFCSQCAAKIPGSTFVRRIDDHKLQIKQAKEDVMPLSKLRTVIAKELLEPWLKEDALSLFQRLDIKVFHDDKGTFVKHHEGTVQYCQWPTMGEEIIRERLQTRTIPLAMYWKERLQSETA
jgi:hypothetical protein